MSGDFTFLKGNIETIILCALYNQDMYGYEIAKSIKERTENQYEIKQPTLYAYLKRLEEDGYILSYWGAESNGGRRRYYKLTQKGRQDCEKFLAEWQYQRTVMGNLVDGTANVESISQEEATTLFGRKGTKKPRRRTFEEQDEIARKLNALENNGADQNKQEEKPVEVVQEQEVQEEQKPAEQVAQQVEPVVAEQKPADTVSQQQPAQVVQEQQPQPQQVEQVAVQQNNRRFEVRQDDADSFIQDFDNLAQQVSQKKQEGSNEPQQGENYQHTLLNIIGDQFDQAQNVQSIQQPIATTAIDNQAVLEEVADNLAREGIRLRIYNHAAANFKSQTLIPNPKVLCQTAWLTYAVASVLFALLAILSIGCNNWLPSVITLAILVILPIAISFYALANQIRIEKPKFNYKLWLIGSLIVAFIVLMACVAISAFSNLEWRNFADVGNKVLIPTIIALLPAIFVFFYNVFYKRY